MREICRAYLVKYGANFSGANSLRGESTDIPLLNRLVRFHDGAYHFNVQHNVLNVSNVTHNYQYVEYEV